MMRLREGGKRGSTRLSWLDSRHSFSFGDYRDPAWDGFHVLRVLNDDRVSPGQGFPTHPHAEMEILSWVLSGELEHKDSTDSGSVIRPGTLQRMSAGTGIHHSEWNPSATVPVHFLQVWIVPAKRRLPPEWEERAFPEPELAGRLRLVASPDGRDGSIPLRQDAEVRIARLAAGEEVTHDLAAGRHLWLHVAAGKAQSAGHALAEGDGLALSGEPRLSVRATEPAEILVFDLP